MPRKSSTRKPEHHLSHITPDLRPLAVPIDGLEPDPANARTHGTDDLAALSGSLRQYGQRTPLVVNRESSIVLKGNGTLASARQLGWTHLAVVWVEDDPHTAAGYAIADNRTAELAGWDTDRLKELLAELDSETLSAELAGMFDGLADLADGLTASAMQETTRPAGTGTTPADDDDDAAASSQADDDPPPAPPTTTVKQASTDDQEEAPAEQSAGEHIPDEYHVLIICESDPAQRALFERFTADGRTCRLNFSI